MSRTWTGNGWVLVLPLLLAGCLAAPGQDPGPAGSAPPRPAAPARDVIVTARPGTPLELHWFRNSAERVALFEQTYAVAAARIESLAPTLAGKAWAVVMDADETILDNSDYQVRLAMTGRPHDESQWAVWTADRSAGLLPGAAGFIDTVRRAGGRVVVVTNRREASCADTRANLEALGIAVDGVLCKRDASDKASRFAAVSAGSSPLGLPPLEIVMFVGDNIKDCPGQSQQQVDAALFGTRCFLLPNPMYGSWVGNPWR